MSSIYYDYFNRVINRRNFVVSFVLGIISGGLINLLTHYLGLYLGTLRYAEYIPGGVFILSILIFYIAISLSSKSESIVFFYNASISPENIVSICDSILSEFDPNDTTDPNYEKIEIFKQKLSELRNEFDDEDKLKTCKYSQVEELSQTLIDSITFPLDETTSKLFDKLGDYLKDIENLNSIIIDLVKNQKSMYEKDGILCEDSSDGIAIKKRYWRFIKQKIMKIKVRQNSNYSVITPSLILVEMFPDNLDEFLEFHQKYQRMLSQIRWGSDLLELGVKFTYLEESDVSERIISEINSNSELIKQEIMNDLNSIETRLTHLKIFTKKNGE